MCHYIHDDDDDVVSINHGEMYDALAARPTPRSVIVEPCGQLLAFIVFIM